MIVRSTRVLNRAAGQRERHRIRKLIARVLRVGAVISVLLGLVAAAPARMAAPEANSSNLIAAHGAAADTQLWQGAYQTVRPGFLRGYAELIPAGNGVDVTGFIAERLRSGTGSWLPYWMRMFDTLPLNQITRLLGLGSADFKRTELKGVDQIVVCGVQTESSVPGNVYAGYYAVQFPLIPELAVAATRIVGGVLEGFEKPRWEYGDNPDDAAGYEAGLRAGLRHSSDAFCAEFIAYRNAIGANLSSDVQTQADTPLKPTADTPGEADRRVNGSRTQTTVAVIEDLVQSPVCTPGERWSPSEIPFLRSLFAPETSLSLPAVSLHVNAPNLPSAGEGWTSLDQPTQAEYDERGLLWELSIHAELAYCDNSTQLPQSKQP